MEATQDRTVQAQLTITEFLEARITEDEAEAKWVEAEGDNGSSAVQHPARILAECAAKRAIVSMGRWAVFSGHTAGDNCGLSDQDTHNAAMVGLEVLAVVAAVYSSHPDYRQEWAPRG